MTRSISRRSFASLAGAGEREEVAKQNIGLQKDLAAAGMIFNEVDPAPFRETLSKAGFYKEWRGKFGDEPWALLEEAVGKLA